jgi:hypothetical protein
MAVTRAMQRFRHEGEEEEVERVLTSYKDGSFLVDRLGSRSPSAAAGSCARRSRA